ncbi:MAG: OmpA family protein [Bergeyella sp.]|nr:OmpA family protein [Bergeyella sp.]
MKINLTRAVVLVFLLPAVAFAQTSLNVSNRQSRGDTLVVAEVRQTTGDKKAAKTRKFNQKSKKFNDWSFSVGAGTPLVQNSDYTSIRNGNGKWLFGYSTYLSIDKAVSHVFGFKFQYDRGETRQGWFNIKDPMPGRAEAGRTQYDALSLLGDVNISNIFRRIDNKSPFRWALHGYLGVGTIAYRAYQKSPRTEGVQKLITEEKPFRLGSVFSQLGTGLKYRVARSLDIEGRMMYMITGDDTFDGRREPGNRDTDNRRKSNNVVNTTLGITYNIGEHKDHLFWYDPLQGIYDKLDELGEFRVCKSGDKDNDGVCDDWDRQLDTPSGARVDGAGVALDTDMDGVIDLYDKCVTVPGPVENEGCPVTEVPVPAPDILSEDVVVKEEERTLEGIEFDFDSDRILPSNTPILNNAAEYIISSRGSFNIIGATDAKGTDEYNQKLSERRANSVKDYLVQNGVPGYKLNAIGRGKRDLKYPQCDPADNCPEWKNRANRRVYFEAR